MSDRLSSKSVRLSQEQIEALEEYARQDKREVSSVIRIAIDDFLDRARLAKIQPQHREAVPA